MAYWLGSEARRRAMKGDITQAESRPKTVVCTAMPCRYSQHASWLLPAVDGSPRTVLAGLCLVAGWPNLPVSLCVCVRVRVSGEDSDMASMAPLP